MQQSIDGQKVSGKLFGEHASLRTLSVNCSIENELNVFRDKTFICFEKHITVSRSLRRPFGITHDIFALETPSAFAGALEKK